MITGYLDLSKIYQCCMSIDVRLISLVVEDELWSGSKKFMLFMSL